MTGNGDAKPYSRLPKACAATEALGIHLRVPSERRKTPIFSEEMFVIWVTEKPKIDVRE